MFNSRAFLVNQPLFLSVINLNWSKMDQFIFSNHCYSDHDLTQILGTFKNCKIIRLLPSTLNEQKIINWLACLKNSNVATSVPRFDADSSVDYKQYSDQRILTIYFGNLMRSKTFESTYQSVLDHLGLPCAAVSYEFVKFWISKQDARIQECILRLIDY